MNGNKFNQGRNPQYKRNILMAPNAPEQENKNNYKLNSWIYKLWRPSLVLNKTDIINEIYNLFKDSLFILLSFIKKINEI